MPRRFHAAYDAAPAVRAQWCRPGEEPAWTVPFEGTAVRYEMPGRRLDGMPQPGLGMRALRAATGMGAPARVTGGKDSDGNRLPAPGVVAFGPGPDCLAAALAEAAPDVREGFWVLTDRRFAFLVPVPAAEPDRQPQPRGLLARARALAEGAKELLADPKTVPHDPVDLREHFSYGLGEFRLDGVHERTLKGFRREQVRYDRVLLPDGSGVDFRRGNG